MLGLALLVLSTQSAAEPAKTINGQELGPAERFTTAGPATVCMRELVIRPRPGQKVQLGYSGIHNGTLRLFLESGAYVDFTVSDIPLDQRRRGEAPSASRDDMNIYLLRDQRPKVGYQLEGVGRRTDDYTPPRVMADGPGLAADKIDDRIFEEVTFAEPKKVHCDRRYEFGWGVLLNGEPFDIRNNATGK